MVSIIKSRTSVLAVVAAAISLVASSSVSPVRGLSATQSAAAQDAAQIEPARSDLVVHEWGTFTSVAGRDGVAVEWRPLDGATDLPGFVYAMEGFASGKGLRNGRVCVKCNLEALVRMETPVIYFYSDHPSTVSVRVDFPEGKITEWYPQARGAYDNVIDWGRITVLPGANLEFPVEAAESHYYPARETDSAPLRVCSKTGKTEQEKFLFYRGVGSFRPPLNAIAKGQSVAFESPAGARVNKVLLFENREGRMGYAVCDLKARSSVVTRPELTATLAGLERDLKSLLVQSGLFEKEAQAMLNTWRDSWFEEGLRAFYIVPRKVTDRVLPISIEPQPAELTRVLVGRIEMITDEMEATVAKSSMSDEGAVAAREKYGRFLEPIVKRALENAGDYVVKQRLKQLLTN